jgi:hypothetical protein
MRGRYECLGNVDDDAFNADIRFATTMTTTRRQRDDNDNDNDSDNDNNDVPTRL